MEATVYAVLTGYAAFATAIAIAAGRQSWRHGRRGYAFFAYAVAAMAVVIGGATLYVRAVRP